MILAELRLHPSSEAKTFYCGSWGWCLCVTLDVTRWWLNTGRGWPINYQLEPNLDAIVLVRYQEQITEKKKVAYASTDSTETLPMLGTRVRSYVKHSERKIAIGHDRCTFKANNSSPNLSRFRKRKWSDHRSRAARRDSVGNMQRGFFSALVGCSLQHSGPIFSVKV